MYVCSVLPPSVHQASCRNQHIISASVDSGAVRRLDFGSVLVPGVSTAENVNIQTNDARRELARWVAKILVVRTEFDYRIELNKFSNFKIK